MTGSPLSPVRATMSAPFVQQAFMAEGISVRPRGEARDTWDELGARGISYVPVHYTSSMIDYQHAYMAAADAELADLSVVVYHDNRPAGIWPLTAVAGPDGASLGSHVYPVMPPLLRRDLALKTQLRIAKAACRVADGLAGQFELANWRAYSNFQGIEQAGISLWHEQLAARGARISVRHELFVDLSLDLESIRTQFRKSYKPLISSASRLWQVSIMRERDETVWDEFRALHLHAAGRATRSDESWRLQHEALARGEAFAVCLRDADGALVGCGYFSLSATEGDYSVAAYDRSLFDKPLGHLVQYHAIDEMKRRALRWYRVGSRPVRGDSPTPSAKELSIGDFKQGFATHMFPVFEFEMLTGDRA